MNSAMNFFAAAAGQMPTNAQAPGAATPQGQAQGKPFSLVAAAQSGQTPTQGGGGEAPTDGGARMKLTTTIARLLQRVQGAMESGSSEQGLETAALLSSDLATALAEFDAKTGGDLLSKLRQMLEGLTGEGAETLAETADGTAPSEPLPTLQAVLQMVQTALEDLPGGMPEGIAHAMQAVMGPSANGTQIALNLASAPVTQAAVQADAGADVSAEALLADAAESVVEALTGETEADATPEVATNPTDSTKLALLRQIMMAAQAALPSGAGATDSLPADLKVDPVRLTVDDLSRIFSTHELPQGSQETQAAQATRQVAQSAEPTRFASALLGQVRAADLGEGTTRIELNPRGLGNMEIELKTNSDGSLAVVVRAENSAVLNSLREERDLLAIAIANTDAGSLEFQDFQDPSRQQSNDSNGLTGLSGSGGESEDMTDAAPAHTETIGGGQLDLMT